MKKALIFGAIGVAVLAVGIGMFIASQNRPADTDTTNDSAQQTPSSSTDTTTTEPDTTDTAEVVNVSYTDNGFEPSDLGTLKVGQKVVFTNNSSRSMWIASNEHPVHTDYPEFDQKENVSAGGTYTFTFDKVGTWGFHNHAASQHTGTVTVVAE